MSELFEALWNFIEATLELLETIFVIAPVLLLLAGFCGLFVVALWQ